MRAGRATTLTRWVLVGALVFSVFGMHALLGPANEQAVAVSSGHHEPADHEGHDPLDHLCLAILAIAAGIGLLLALVREHTPAPVKSPVPVGDHARPPPSSIRLATLCVLRR